MKALKISMLVMPFIVACTTTEPAMPCAEHTTSEESIFQITQEEAYGIASNLFGDTRSESLYSVNYIVNRQNADTLAYVLQRDNSEGWVIVSTDKRTQQVLAFSEGGTLNYSEDDANPLYAEFISQLPGYFKTKREENLNQSGNVSYGPALRELKTISPKLSKGYWHQHEPWNYYVKDSLNRTNPEYWRDKRVAVGCVALATSLLMSNCKSSLLYNGIDFDFDFMLQCIKDSIVAPVLPPIIVPIVPGIGSQAAVTTPKISRYSTGVDLMGKLLLHVGRDVHTTYGDNYGSAHSTYSIRLLKRLGYDVKNDGSFYLLDYNPQDMVNHLNNNRLIYISGKWNGKTYPDGSYEEVNVPGHAWIIDGCKYFYTLNNPSEPPSNIYFHHEWCEENASSGYFSAEVMQILVQQRLLHMDIESFSYFAVTIEK